jgi:hypothetical protein
LEGIVVGIGFTGCAISFALLMIFNSRALKGAQSPDPAHALTAPYNNHGTMLYISNDLSLWISIAFWSFMVFLLCTVFVLGRRQWGGR